ncbi:helix-turn-helix domain-containing protein [Wolbachia endosymbiont of Folsomia candida]|uniref:helix-turn-helix domain-containing protein n=1 Tax=Wolbachia endosymbiont of Folsomia candida TaxID=169402 RepID=UPI000AEBC33E|nr:XRE family transcriptional regulator [Wolbachia endosymbiont of Folsomia candida]APR98619.1 hypothetical protein ASM33_05205 [Wolbachia endosymbiont of Folsomia candida]
MVKKITASGNNAKTELLNLIKSVIEEKNWKQREAANVLKLDQPKVSSIVNLKAKRFSLEKIFTLLSRLDHEIEITVKKTNLD